MRSSMFLGALRKAFQGSPVEAAAKRDQSAVLALPQKQEELAMKEGKS
jgi:hypothetical protein